MIKQLKNKVFFILMLSISAIILGIIAIYAYSNYNNTINSGTSMLDRIGEPARVPTNGQLEMHNDENRFSMDLSNTYFYIIENGKIKSNVSEKNEQIENYAIKAYKQNKVNGIVGNYVYKLRTLKDGRTSIILMENENVVARIRNIYIYTILGAIASICLACVISKKITNMIVKPVEETIENQKQFISDASHELKTPLAVIEANVDVLENQIGKNKWMTYIQSEISSMNKLINDLLFLAKVGDTKKVYSREIFDISEEVNMVSSMFESMAYEKKIKINYSVKENIKFNGNKEDIKHVLSILIENAISHTNENGNIFIELLQDKNNIVLQVKNEGEPIPEEEQSKIFERFYRVDKSRNRKEKRYGLGLAIAKSIVEQYNGKIEVNCNDGITSFKVII